MEKLHRYKLVAVALIAVLMTSSFLLACSSDEEVASPRQVAQEFMVHLARANSPEALEMVWPATRAEIFGVVEEMEAELGWERDEALREVITMTRVNSPFLVERIDVVEGSTESPSHGDTVQLSLAYRDGRESSMVLRWDRRWYVDLALPEALDGFER